jgi:hypothetical protein
MNEPSFYFTAQIIESLATTLGIIVAGLWAFFTFKKKREVETAISLDLVTYSQEYNNDHYIVVFEAIIRNRCHTKLKARYNCSSEFPFDFKDGTGEKYKSAFDLKIVPFPQNIKAGSVIYWYHYANEPILEIDLLQLYRNFPKIPSFACFWMEPDEEHKFGIPVILPAGLYMAKLTFLGEDEIDFWSRIFLVKVPQLKNTVKSEKHKISIEAFDETGAPITGAPGK